MGIVNVTPDSFSDGGKWFDPGAAIDRALQLIADGADIIDVGGESTRPGAEPVACAEEMTRVIPVVTGIAKQSRTPISIDTMKADVARACMDVGAEIVNDVAGLSCGEMVNVVRSTGAGAVVMHMQGTPQTMQLHPQYGSVVDEVAMFFESRLSCLAKVGIDLNRLAIDPGIGFGKTSQHNLQLIDGLPILGRCGRPVVLGVSRKGFLGKLLDRPVNERMPAGLAAACFAMVTNSVQVIRTHDVAATCDAVRTIQAIRASQ